MTRRTWAILWTAAAACCTCPISSAVAETGDPIFNGHSLDGWTTLDGKPVGKGWEVVDGVIHLQTGQGRAGHIVTEREYGSFELRFDWKIAERGNSGLKYRVRQYDNKIIGCEYQILDDSRHRGGPLSKGSTGSLYDIYPPNSAKQMKPAGEYNSSRIVVQGNRVEHWLNGVQILSVCIGSCDWYEKKAESKFSDVDGFGESRYGKIMLTDHNSEVWFRNLTLTELPDPSVQLAGAGGRGRLRSRSTATRGGLLGGRLLLGRRR